MQEKSPSRSNRERSETTRNALLSAARELFIEKGYAETSTPEIVAAAGITRGALYHHFSDKRDLFRAVLEREAESVASDIELAGSKTLPVKTALLAGSLAYLDAMRVNGRTRLLLIDGPAVLGAEEIAALDNRHAARTLSEGLAAAQTESGIPLAAMATLLSAAFDRAALAIEAGGDPEEYRNAVTLLVERVVFPSGSSS